MSCSQTRYYKQNGYCCVLGFHMTSDDDISLFVKVKEKITINFQNLFDIAISLRVLKVVFFKRLSDFRPPTGLRQEVNPTIKVFPISVSPRLRLRNLHNLSFNIIYLFGVPVLEVCTPTKNPG